MKKMLLILGVIGSVSFFAQETEKTNTKNLAENPQVKEIMRALNGQLRHICYKSSYGNSKVYIGYF